MSEDQPPKLDYRSAPRNAGKDLFREDRQALWGLLLGILISAFSYCLVPIRDDSALARPIVIALAKVGIFIVAVWFRRSRVFAIGMLISVLFGFIILFGAVCGGIRVWR